MTISPWIAPAPYAYEYPTILILLLGAPWEATFAGVLFSPLGIWDAEGRIVLGNVSRPFGLSLSVLSYFFLLGAGLGLSIKWAGVVRFLGPTIACCPAPRMERRVLVTSGLCHGLSSINAKASLFVRDTFLAPWYTKRVFIKC